MGAALLAGGSPADTQPEPAKSAVAEKKADADPVVCRTYDQLGSRIAQKRVCKKSSQWVLDDADMRGQHINQLNQMRSNGPPNG
jgi:hypothetical protein